MLVEQIWTGNAWRNYNYLIACSRTGEAIAVDPLEHVQVLARQGKGWEITQIVNTMSTGSYCGNDAASRRDWGEDLAHTGRIQNCPYRPEVSLPETLFALERPSSSKFSTRRATRCPTSAYSAMRIHQLYSAATRFSTPVLETVIMAEVRTSCTLRLPASLRSFPARRACFQVMITSRRTSNSR